MSTHDMMKPAELRAAIAVARGRLINFSPAQVERAEAAGYVKREGQLPVLTQSGFRVLSNGAPAKRGRKRKPDARRAQVTVYTSDEIDTWLGLRAASLGMSKGRLVHYILARAHQLHLREARCVACGLNACEGLAPLIREGGDHA